MEYRQYLKNKDTPHSFITHNKNHTTWPHQWWPVWWPSDTGSEGHHTGLVLESSTIILFSCCQTGIVQLWSNSLETFSILFLRVFTTMLYFLFFWGGLLVRLPDPFKTNILKRLDCHRSLRRESSLGISSCSLENIKSAVDLHSWKHKHLGIKCR
jgi:hypothetical protein